jgi:DNA-binding transcriptional LysR family regulator
MSLNRLDLNLLVAFDALMTELNVSKAAEKLFIGQSAMSHSLNRLRQTFDDPILVRTTGGMKPTARAQELIEPIRKALLEIEVTVTTKQAFEPKTAQQRFVIAASDYNELILLPSLIKRVRELAPRVDIHVRQPSEYLPEEDLENGNINVVLGFDVSLETPSRKRCGNIFCQFIGGGFDCGCILGDTDGHADDHDVERGHRRGRVFCNRPCNWCQ